METIEGDCEQKWDKGENEWRKEEERVTERVCVIMYACMHLCARVRLTVPLHAGTCFPVCTMCVLHISQLCQQY